MECHSLPVGNRNRYSDESHETVLQNVQCHSPAVGDRRRSNETAFHLKMCNVTHNL